MLTKMFRFSRIFWKAISPVYYPLRISDFFYAIAGTGQVPNEGLYLSSGEHALYTALLGVRQLRDPKGIRDELIIPSFICPSVHRAVREAGLKVVSCSLDTDRWCYRPEALSAAVGEKTLGVLLVYYFGLPPDCSKVIKILKNFPVIEDRAQAYGYKGISTKDLDVPFCIYSFGPGKSLPLNFGGLVSSTITSENNWMNYQMEKIPSPKFFQGFMNLFLSFLQGMVLHPSIWPLLPFTLKLNPAVVNRIHTKPFRLNKFVLRYLRQASFRLPKVIESRRNNACLLAKKLTGIPGLHLPEFNRLREGVCLRFPVLLEDKERARRIREQITLRGLIKGPNDWYFYACGVGDSLTEALDISARLITLPTFPGSEKIYPDVVKLFQEI